ncbi:MAG: hypothetical protein JWN72_1299 [Thermoleophilia bacterium]|nr:hypothetical protein [Thermoleophilia bacterium]
MIENVLHNLGGKLTSGLDEAIYAAFSDVYEANRGRYDGDYDDNHTFGKNIHRGSLKKVPGYIAKLAPGVTVEVRRDSSLVLETEELKIWTFRMGSKLDAPFSSKRHMNSVFRRSMTGLPSLRLFANPLASGLLIQPRVDQMFVALGHSGNATNGLEQLQAGTVTEVAVGKFSWQSLGDIYRRTGAVSATSIDPVVPDPDGYLAKPDPEVAVTLRSKTRAIEAS